MQQLLVYADSRDPRLPVDACARCLAFFAGHRGADWRDPIGADRARDARTPDPGDHAAGDHRCVGRAAAYRQVCEEAGCHFFNAGSVVTSSRVDGVHLDAVQHRVLGEAVARPVEPLLLQGR